jgi:DNA polymerase-3 subunit gamma/tau
MSSQSLYRKWRPQQFSDLKGQDSIRDTLFHAASHGEVAQAYLFCGPRGTGKTTTARLIAKVVNCQSETSAKPCNTCAACTSITNGTNLDSIEVDAASNRGIDEIRQLRESVRFAPTQAKWKVYIIDEVHMLTREAFNALLKTLEEPPKYALFILATTEVHKIPPTIISRCQRYDFKTASLPTLTDHLVAVAKAEKLPLPQEGAVFLARLADGSFRDALSLLDQLQASGLIDWSLTTIEALFGYIPTEQMNRVVTAILTGDIATAHALVDEIEARGSDLRAFWAQLLDISRIMLESRLTGDLKQLNRELKAVVERLSVKQLLHWVELLLVAGQDMKQSPIIRLPLDLAMTKYLVDSQEGEPKTSPPPAKLPGNASPTISSIVSEKKVAQKPRLEPVGSATNPTVAVPVAEIVNTPFSTDHWQSLLRELKGEAPSLVTSLSHAKVTEENDTVNVGVRYKMHADKINQTRNREKIEEILTRLSGKSFKITAHVVRELVVEEEEVDIAEIFELE